MMKESTIAVNHATYGGGLIAVIGGMTAHDIAAVCGLILALGGFITNFIFLWRKDRRDAALFTRQQRALSQNDAAKDH